MLSELGIKHVWSSAYHPKTQDALERYQQTLKKVLQKYCEDHTMDWDKGLPFLLFNTREVPQESLGFSSNQSVFTHQVRGHLEQRQGHQQESTTVCHGLHSRIHETLQLSRKNLKAAQVQMKQRFNGKARPGEFWVGEEVFVLLPFQGKPLTARSSGPYVIEKRVGEVDYVVKMLDRRKSHQLCHVNMLKWYHRLSCAVPVVQYAASVVDDDDCEAKPTCDSDGYSWLINDEAESTLQSKLLHLP